ncbi:hypothetical protein GCM10010116_14320 [Microbispora rosea subsp. aerata]|nr:hypothetical protein GCM10010116_14320 [Microbispora rosea subsp. aerata]GIH53133.1 hypothetical protein Mro02_00470 [Microbispora rosea subsp. aerata]GLJ83956.1 hypothetical protein GCM10017588_26840 [Microbispora rosea subsp. aerata]
MRRDEPSGPDDDIGPGDWNSGPWGTSGEPPGPLGDASATIAALRAEIRKREAQGRPGGPDPADDSMGTGGSAGARGSNGARGRRGFRGGIDASDDSAGFRDGGGLWSSGGPDVADGSMGARGVKGARGRRGLRSSGGLRSRRGSQQSEDVTGAEGFASFDEVGSGGFRGRRGRQEPEGVTGAEGLAAFDEVGPGDLGGPAGPDGLGDADGLGGSLWGRGDGGQEAGGAGRRRQGRGGRRRGDRAGLSGRGDRADLLGRDNRDLPGREDRTGLPGQGDRTDLSGRDDRADAPGWGDGAERGGRERSGGWLPDGPQEETSASEGPQADPEAVARAICLRLLTMAPKTRAQLADALRKRDVPEAAANAVLERFSEVGLIDDEAFAAAWVSSRHAGRGLARRALAQELRQRGVAEETVKDAVGRLDPDEEIETARRLVERKLAATRGVEPRARMRRLVGMLARKGYSPGLAFRVVREAIEAEGGPSDELPDTFE